MSAPKRYILPSGQAKRTRPMTSKKPKSRVPRVIKFGNQPFPKQTESTVTYCDQFVISMISGGYNQYVFNCNGLYDPNYSGTGHQPLYFDQLMTIYNHYCVTESTITVTPFTNTTGTGLTVCLFQDDDTATGSILNITSAIERPGAVYCCSNGTAGPFYPTSLKNTWKAKNVFAGDPLSRDELAGGAAANPTEMTHWYIGISDMLLQSNTIQFNVVIKYKATFFELKTVTQS